MHSTYFGIVRVTYFGIVRVTVQQKTHTSGGIGGGSCDGGL